ncbi:hypothetical protein HK102_011185, partial [Quaeritorhiza haematococci]
MEGVEERSANGGGFAGGDAYDEVELKGETTGQDHADFEGQTEQEHEQYEDEHGELEEEGGGADEEEEG